jgi:hypothetical protein
MIGPNRAGAAIILIDELAHGLDLCPQQQSVAWCKEPKPQRHGGLCFNAPVAITVITFTAKSAATTAPVSAARTLAPLPRLGSSLSVDC